MLNKLVVSGQFRDVYFGAYKWDTMKRSDHWNSYLCDTYPNHLSNIFLIWVVYVNTIDLHDSVALHNAATPCRNTSRLLKFSKLKFSKMVDEPPLNYNGITEKKNKN